MVPMFIHSKKPQVIEVTEALSLTSGGRPPDLNTWTHQLWKLCRYLFCSGSISQERHNAALVQRRNSSVHVLS